MIKKVFLPITLLWILYGFYAFEANLEPAHFWNDLLNPDHSNRLDQKVILTLTLLTVILPMFMLGLLVITFQNLTSKNRKPDFSNQSGIWIHRKIEFWALLSPLPAYINNIKVGSLNAGQTSFFNANPGEVIITIGEGNKTYEHKFQLKEFEQLQFNLNMVNTPALDGGKYNYLPMLIQIKKLNQHSPMKSN